MKKIKAIFIDIDGTLTNDQGIIPENVKEVIGKLTAQGIKVIVTSGRNFNYTKKISQSINASSIIIAANGAIAANYETKEIIEQVIMPRVSVQKVLHYCTTHDVGFTMHTKTRQVKINNPKDIIEDVLSLTLTSTNYERMKIMKNMFHDIIPEVRIANTSKALIENHRMPGSEYFHDIVMGNVSKGTGIAEVLDYLNISKDEAMSIGDSDNDIAMTLVVGTSIAMGNATENLKKCSTQVIKSNTCDGLYLFLKTLVDNN